MKSPNPRAITCVLLFLILAGVQAAFAETKSDEAWQILRANLSEKASEKRVQAVRVLGLLPGDPQALEIAQKAVQDEKPEVRVAAASTLGELNVRSSIALLHKLLSDSEPSVVLAAASALIKFKDPAAYEAYYEFLTGERKTSTGLIAQEMKTLKDPKKMAELGVEQGIGFIPFAGIGLSAFQTLRADDVSPVRAAAAKMLGDDPDPESAKALVKATSDKSWLVKTAALEAVTKRGDPQLLDAIVFAMKDDNTSVRCTAAAAVIRLSTLAAVKTAKEKNAGSSTK
jgi:HEAT repeat protein